MAEKEAPEAGRRLHVTVLLVASRRALDNALNELGFAEDDDRVIEHDGRLAFLTCTHEEDCDDLFALITELSARSESWELQSRIDTEAGRAVYQSLARHRPVDAVDAAVDEDVEPDAVEPAALDIETSEGLQALKRLLRRVEPAEVFATIRPGREGRATARILRRNSRRQLAAATASDEATLRGVLREILPNVMLDVAMKPPS
ncbi:MAG TPA: hypothetical protein VGQ90_01100 [Stellaceae bacterium]|jgi:hypothetical protein|nr:hypothetical protein [Stellaceae bacterium]